MKDEVKEMIDAVAEYLEPEGDSVLEKMLRKTAPSNLDCDFYLTTLLQFPENEWVKPTNECGEHYFILSHLYELSLVECLRTPRWSNGLFRGNTVQFRYCLDLNYGGGR